VNDEVRGELRDIKNTVEWELIRVTSVIADEELRPGEARSLRAAESKLADVVLTLLRLSR